jgi:hypothetical protein
MLTVVEVKGAQPRTKDYKLADSGGLYLFVTTKGHRSWRYRATFRIRIVLPYENMFPGGDDVASPKCSLRRSVD